ncbi:M3 family oligoendopeptidase [Halobacillus litoralis]|uniref:M3 family oligoendopeptidase n=1 Tax=Halobacillus litoralis TaxID=45668 RepID=UPI001CD2CF23|nr:M3 family oligoendopeptidase [Halobacillus litoralis]MCA0969337.1 M3 family oligoendopeptidase [Halobacillus litoralis]
MNTALNQQWDLASIYDGGAHSEALAEHIAAVSDRVEPTLQRIKEGSSMTSVVEIIEDVQDIVTQAFQIDEFCICLASEDTSNQEAAKWLDRSHQLQAKVESLSIELKQLFKSLNESDWNELFNREELTTIQPYLHNQKQNIDGQLLQPVEDAINQLSINGIKGWEDHFEKLFHQLRVHIDGEDLSINEAIIKSMLNPDREIRKETAKAVERTCAENAHAFASTFNHFAGFRLDIYRLREWSNVQTELFEKNKISAQAVESMMNAIQGHQEKVRAFLKRKAEVMGLEKLSYYDLHQPAFTSKSKVTYDEAASIIQKQFHQFSSTFGKLADTSFSEGWIDAEPRKTKQFGGFCASIPLERESRILVTFEENYQDLVTLAHELGHAYHNSVLQPLPAFAQKTGTGLAETASTFAENLVLDAAKKEAETEDDQLGLLEMQISNAIKYVTIVPSKFDFEKRFYQQREKDKLSAEELTTLMVETEKEWLDLEEYDGYHWMTIPHFYSSDQSFFNIPYTIGYLFSNGLYALSDQEGFASKYDELLKHSGSLSIDELAERFLGEDIKDQAFWNRALEPVMTAIDDFLEKTKTLRA